MVSFSEDKDNCQNQDAHDLRIFMIFIFGYATPITCKECAVEACSRAIRRRKIPKDIFSKDQGTICPQ